MKWEEAIDKLAKIIPEASGYFTLEVEQFWHCFDGKRREIPAPPVAKVCIERGPEGVWVQIYAPTFEDLLNKVERAYIPKPEAPAAIEAAPWTEEQVVEWEKQEDQLEQPIVVPDTAEEAIAIADEQGADERKQIESAVERFPGKAEDYF